MVSTSEEIVTLASHFGTVGVALAVAAVPVAATIAAYVTRMASQGKIDRLEGERDRLKDLASEEVAKADQRYATLEEKYQAMLRSGALIQTQLQTIISEADDIAARLDADDYAVLVPAPTSIPGDEPDYLVFLCASGDQAAKLKWVRVPIDDSLSGKVYRSGQTTIASPSSSGAAFSNRTDKITDYKTNEALSVCLRHRSTRLGVAQFLNKRGGRPFSSDDRERAQVQCMTLAIRVADFLSDPRRLIELGHAPRQDQIDATIMFIDLSHFSALFSSLDSSVITDILNQYFQDLCAIALRHGAVIDQFIGDGAMLTFNVSQRESAHPKVAFAAALEMRDAFPILRERWKTLGYGGDLFVRIGLACGAVARAEIGHTHASRRTVIGRPVNAAAYACQFGPRDRDSVIVTPEFKERLAADVKLAGVATATGSQLFEAVG